MEAYDGIDVSHHQGRIRWKQVAANKKIRFVYIKATQGATIRDSRYKTNITEARRAGLRCGSYHVLSSETPIRQQFKLFKSMAKLSQQDLIPMIDVEQQSARGWTNKQLRDSLTLLCNLMRNHYGKRPLIYCHNKQYNQQLAPHFNNYMLFLAKYSWPAPTIQGHGRHNIWQYSERGRVRGIDGYVDLDRFVNGTSIKHIRLK